MKKLMCKIQFIKDNGCFPNQKLISCAVEHNRLNEAYGLGKILYVCSSMASIKGFLKCLHPESGLRVAKFRDVAELSIGVDTVYIERSEKFALHTMHPILLKNNVSGIVTTAD